MWTPWHPISSWFMRALKSPPPALPHIKRAYEPHLGWSERHWAMDEFCAGCNRKMVHKLVPPSDVCYFITSLTIDLFTISPSEIGVINQLSHLGGTTLPSSFEHHIAGTRAVSISMAPPWASKVPREVTSQLCFPPNSRIDSFFIIQQYETKFNIQNTYIAHLHNSTVFGI